MDRSHIDNKVGSSPDTGPFFMPGDEVLIDGVLCNIGACKVNKKGKRRFKVTNTLTGNAQFMTEDTIYEKVVKGVEERSGEDKVSKVKKTDDNRKTIQQILTEQAEEKDKKEDATDADVASASETTVDNGSEDETTALGAGSRSRRVRSQDEKAQGAEVKARYENGYETGDLISDVRFTFQKIGIEMKFVSTKEGRKRIVLRREKNTPRPQEGKPYIVEVVRDSHPDSSNKGVVIVRTIEIDVANMTQEELKEIEYKKISSLPKPIEVIESQGIAMVHDISIPLAERRGKYSIDHAKFEHTYTIDRRTLDVLKFIAEAVQLKRSCLLTGETATSKTSAIEYLASITGYEVIRINLNGHTDTSELIGKYVPNDGQVKIRWEQMLKRPEALSPQTQEILEKAYEKIIDELDSQGNPTGKKIKVPRELTEWECQQIAKFEDMDVPEWRWQDGAIPKAMKRGAWLILDEVNLADQAIRERLNPVLEDPPSIVITEHQGETIRPFSDEERNTGSISEDIEECKSGFQMFGTQNPAEYAGRKAMSPAEKRRWRYRMTVPEPDADQYEANLIHVVYGIQPDIYETNEDGTQGNKIFIGHKGGMSQYPLLAQTPNMELFLTKLAMFHAGIALMCKEKELKRSAKEKEIFTREGLITFLHIVAKLEIWDRSYSPPKPVLFSDEPGKFVEHAIKRVYLGKFEDSDDRAKIMVLLQATDIFDYKGKCKHLFTEEEAGKKGAGGGFGAR